MKNILYIIDDKARLRDFIKYIEDIKGTESLNFYICPITVDSDLVRQIESGLSGYGKTRVLPFIREFHKNSFSYRDRFIKFLSDFSMGNGKNLINLREYFTYPFDRFSLWWLSLVAEKPTVKRQSYHNLAKLITIVNFKHDYSINEIYIDIKNDALKKAILKNKENEKVHASVRPQKDSVVKLIISLIKAMGYAAFFVIRKCILYRTFRNDTGKRMSVLNEARFLFITYFPFAEKEALETNIFRNKYFGPLQASIEKRYKGRISWIGIPESNAGINTRDIKMARLVNTWGHSLFMPEELISFRQIISAALIFLYTCFKYLLKIPYLSRNYVFDVKKKINIWDLFEEEWTDSFFGSYLMGGLFYYYIFTNVISKIKDEIIILYPAELYAWENALNIVCKRFKKARTVGVQHTSIPHLFLNYFNAPDDLRDGDAIEAFPLLDHLAASGNIPKNLLIESGWPKEKIFDMGAVRYHGLSRFLKKEIDWKQREKQVIVALSSARDEAEEILMLLQQAFGDKDICTFVIKAHPLCPVDSINKPKGFDSFSNKFVLDNDTSLEDLLISSRALIVAGSAASINGIACQCPVIIPKLSCKADINPLSTTSVGLARHVLDKEELVDSVYSVVNSETSPIIFNKFKSFIDDYFTILDDEDGYFMRLESRLGRNKI